MSAESIDRPTGVPPSSPLRPVDPVPRQRQKRDSDSEEKDADQPPALDDEGTPPRGKSINGGDELDLLI